MTPRVTAEQDPWQECPLSTTTLAPGGSLSRTRGRECPLSATALAPGGGVPFLVLPPPGRHRHLRAPGAARAARDHRDPPRGPPGPPRAPPGATGTTESPPGATETTGTTGTTGTPPGATESPPGATKDTEATGTPPKSSETSEATESSPGATGTPPQNAGAPSPRAPPPVPADALHRPSRAAGTPPERVGVGGGGRGGSCACAGPPPPGPYLHSSLVFELALSPPGGPPKTVGVPAGRREQGVGGLRASTPYSVRARARPDGLSYGGFWSPWSAPGSATTAPELDAVTLGLSCLLVLLVLGLGALGLLGHRRTLRAKLWPPVPGPEREFEGLFSAYGGNFQLWLFQTPGSPCAPPAPPPLEAEEALEEVGEGPGDAPPPEAEAPPPGPAPPAQGPSPSPSFEYTLFDPGPALLRPSPRPPGPAPYANLGHAHKGAEPKWAGHAPHYVICS
ncbi:erythropoietin receptor [Vidua macroura]|uniref:erythropoietin receptor n=1 Tax=Vidua macroura TaxID=187451 RepID=UPI0023A9088B|nr:erythropoietin receptor [Vidua macroura]